MSGAQNLGMGMPDAILKPGGADFDPAWYAEQNPDVKAAGIDPATHFQLYGKQEGRAGTPAELANGMWSMLQRSQAEAAPGGISAKDRKSIDAFAKDPYGFDPNFYLAQRPDVAKAKMDPLQHYLQYGKAEGTARNAYEKTYGVPSGGSDGAAPPPPTAPALNPNDPSSWAAWSQKAAAQTQGLNRMPNVAPSTDTLSADPLAVRQQFYPRGNNAGYVFPGAAGAMAQAAPADPFQMTPEQRQQMINLGMRL
jgi:hypothetical protein